MGSKSKSSTKNVNNDLIKGLYTGSAGFTGSAGNSLQALLGGDSGAFDKWQQGTGFQTILQNALGATDGQYSAGGVYGSGARAKALQDRAGEVASGSYNDYVQQLLGLGNMGLQAGGLISGAGQQSTSKTKGGIGDALSGAGGLASGVAAFSDRRLKRGIEKVGELSDGLGIYTYSYAWDSPEDTRIGVMADEVETLRPWALGPETPDGFKSVYYDRLDRN